MIGGYGVDTFVLNGGNDLIRDFDAGADWWFYNRSSDQIVIDINGTDSFEDLMSAGSQSRNTVTFQFSENDSLTLQGIRLAELDADMFSFV